VRFKTGFKAGRRLEQCPLRGTIVSANLMAWHHLQFWRVTMAAKLDLDRGPRPNGIAKKPVSVFRPLKGKSQNLQQHACQPTNDSSPMTCRLVNVRQLNARLRTCRRSVSTNFSHTATVPQ
jgi:hypothetical protein